MNKIVVGNHIVLDSISSDIKIDNNKIIINKSGHYFIEYNTLSTSIEIVISSGINIYLYVYGSSTDMNNKVVYNIGDHSSAIISKFYFAKEVKENIIINLGYDSKINYYFSSITNYQNEYTMSIYHKKANSKSNIVNHILCNKKGKANLTIDSYAYKGAIESFLNQDTKIINIGDNGSVVKPNMYIDEEDITAKHSSSMGYFNEEDMFYLMTRGIDYNDAIKLLSKGFIVSNLYINKEFKEIINNIINKGVIM